MEPSNERHKQVVRDQVAAMERCDAAAQGTFMTDDVTWWVPQSASEAASIPRPLTGKEAVLGMLGGASAWFPEMHWTIDLLLGEGEHVAMHAHMEGRTASGRSYANQYHFLYRFREGLIAEVWEYLDTTYAASRLGP